MPVTDPKDVTPLGSPDKDTPPKKDEPKDEPKEPRVYADKYKNADDLEKAYLESQRQIGTQGNELGKLKNQLKAMQTEMEKGKTAQPDQPNYMAQEAAILEQIKTGDLSLDEALQQITALTRAQTLSEATGQFNQVLNEREAQARFQRFREEHPDFDDFQISSEYEQIQRQNPYFQGDPIGAYHVYQGQLHQLNAANLQAQLADAQKRLEIGEGEKGAKTISKPGSGIKEEATKPKRDGGSLDGALEALQRHRQSL